MEYTQLSLYAILKVILTCIFTYTELNAPKFAFVPSDININIYKYICMLTNRPTIYNVVKRVFRNKSVCTRAHIVQQVRGRGKKTRYTILRI